MVVRFLSKGGNGNGRDGRDGRQAHPRADGHTAGHTGNRPSALTREPAKREATRTGTAVELPEIPEKIYFRIGEVAHLVGVEPHVLRYWEHEFRSIRPTKSQRGQRVYSRRDVEHLRRIRGLLYEQGFTIAGAKKALRARGVEPREDDDPTMVMNAKVREALVDIRHDVEALLRDLGG